jgi:hypothetical protein
LDIPLSLDKAKPSSIPNIRRVEIDPKDLKACEELRTQLRNVCISQPPGDRSGEELGEWIEMISASTVNIVRSNMKAPPKPNRHNRNGSSPEYLVLNRYLTVMINIRRHLTGQAGRHKWPSYHVQFGVRDEIDQLRSYAAGTIPDDDIGVRILSSTGLDPSHWLVVLPTVTTLNEQICLIRKAIHGRKRTEMRHRMETSYLNRERARREMKYRQFISALVGKQKTPFDMSKICKLDGEMECEPTKVHGILTEWFARWFAADRPVNETLHEDQRWADFLNDRTAFDTLLTTTSQPG